MGAPGFYRCKVQFTEFEGKNVLHMVSADVAVFTPEHTRGGRIKLTANLTAGLDFVHELIGEAGCYKIVADPAQFKNDSMLLIQAASKQFAQALRKAQ